jgi:hypothetical protein
MPLINFNPHAMDGAPLWIRCAYAALLLAYAVVMFAGARALWRRARR